MSSATCEEIPHVSGQGVTKLLQHTMERSLCHQEPTGATEKGCWSLRTITELSVLDYFLRFVGFHVNDLSKEFDPNYTIANGNSDPGRGFGHICVSVDNIQAACKRIEEAGYPFQKKLTDGRMRQIAFAKDPDGYWVEIIGQRPLEETEGVNTDRNLLLSLQSLNDPCQERCKWTHPYCPAESQSKYSSVLVLYTAESRLTERKTRAWTETWLH